MKNNFSVTYIMALGTKGNMGGKLGVKGTMGGLLGTLKYGAGVLDNPLTQGIASVISPEAGAALAAAKKIGLLEKVKHM